MLQSPALPAFSPKMESIPNAVSTKLWEPIFDWRTRPVWTQHIVFELLRQLKGLRRARISLPCIDILGLPFDRQLRVSFGDMDGLCDALDNAVDKYGIVVAYGGPDDRGTLWIKFYKVLGNRTPHDILLQFIIWIDSEPPTMLTLEETTNLVLRRATGSTKLLEATRSAHRQQQMRYSEFCMANPDALDLWRDRDIAREVVSAWVACQPRGIEY